MNNLEFKYIEKNGTTYYYHILRQCDSTVVALYQYSFYGDIEEKTVKLLRSDLVSFRQVFDFIA